VTALGGVEAEGHTHGLHHLNLLLGQRRVQRGRAADFALCAASLAAPNTFAVLAPLHDPLSIFAATLWVAALLAPCTIRVPF
jgi:hypothetical protein